MTIKQKHKRVCFTCGDPIEMGAKGNKYIFPVPRRYGLHVHVGVYACPKCAPALQAEQREDGHLEVVVKMRS